jgi:transcriptional regulator with XRE-family HTH domain
LSQQQLADRAGMDRGYLVNIEGGKENPSLRVMGAIAEALGVRLSELITAAERPRRASK